MLQKAKFETFKASNFIFLLNNLTEALQSPPHRRPVPLHAVSRASPGDVQLRKGCSCTDKWLCSLKGTIEWNEKEKNIYIVKISNLTSRLFSSLCAPTF